MLHPVPPVTSPCRLREFELVIAHGLEEHSKLRSISADLLDRNPEFWNDVLHPQRLNRMKLLVHGLASVLSGCKPEILKALEIPEKISALAVRTIEEQQFLDSQLWRDESSLAQDNLDSLFGGEISKYLASLLGAELGQQITSKQLKAVVENAINSLINEPSAKEKWLLIITVIGDLPIYRDLREKFSNLLNNLDIVELYRTEPSTSLFALMVASDQAANSGDENLRSKLEQELVAITRLINSQEQKEPVNPEIADDVIEIALKLAVRANNPRTTSHSLNSLLENIFSACPRFSSRLASVLFRGVRELPANQLHGCWKTVLLLRALFNNEYD